MSITQPPAHSSRSSTVATALRAPAGLVTPHRHRPLALAALLAVPVIVVALFAGALAAVGTTQSRIPAAIVNGDQLVTQTAPDGTETPVLAGRLLVTALTGADSADPAANTFDWRISSADDAAAALKAGEVYAVLTIPPTFSKAVTSLSGEDPVRAQITLETDDAHGYVTGPLTDAVGDGLAAMFGDQISEQYIAGLISGTVTLGAALTEASSGATAIADGARDLGTGLGTLQSGATSAATGAQAFTDGLSSYTDGVDSLSSGLDELSSSSSGLQQLPAGVSQYTGGVTQSAQGLAGLLAAYQAGQLTDAQVVAQLPAISAGLDQLAATGPSLVTGAQGAASVQSGISQIADGADELSGGSAALVSGAQSITDGITQLASGVGTSAAGANQLADGATTLATGLSDGAAKIPSYTDDQQSQLADVASAPITLTATRSNQVSEIPQIVSTLLVPAGLWIGALAVFLAFGALSRRVLASTASSGRIAGRTLARAAVLTAAQAVVLVLLLHAVIGVPWGSIGATLPFALLIAVAFAAIHALLSVAFGRWGLIISLVLLALQLTATGGLYPIELLSPPFQALSPMLPVTSAVGGMQAIVTGTGASAVLSACTGLILWGLISSLLVVLVVSRRRSARSLGLVATA